MLATEHDDPCPLPLAPFPLPLEPSDPGDELLDDCDEEKDEEDCSDETGDLSCLVCLISSGPFSWSHETVTAAAAAVVCGPLFDLSPLGMTICELAGMPPFRASSLPSIPLAWSPF